MFDSIRDKMFVFVAASILHSACSTMSTEREIVANDLHKPANFQMRIGGALSPAFIENRGQLDDAVRYYLKRPDATLFATDSGTRTILNIKDDGQVRSQVLGVDFVSGEPRDVTGSHRARAKVNYFHGQSVNWKTDLPTYTAITYDQLWPGIDLEYRLTDSGVESTYSVKPGASVGAIGLRYTGQAKLEVGKDGTLIRYTDFGPISESAPVAWQVDGDRKQPLAVSYEIHDENLVGFTLGDYDPAKEIIIDPVFTFGTYLGGSGIEEPQKIAVDLSGNILVTGAVLDQDFPTVVGPDNTLGGARDAFIAKLDPTGTTLIYAGFIGGSGEE